MTRIAKIMAAAVLAGGLAAPAAAQVYGQPYPQTYPPGLRRPAYGGYPAPLRRQYGYGNQGVIGSIIDGLIGNRYNVSDRQAVRQCAYAAVQRAESQYRPYFGGQPYAYQGYNGYVRVTAITDVSSPVQRPGPGARAARYGARRLAELRRRRCRRRGRGDLSFRCDVDYSGRVYNVDLDRNGYRRY